MAVNDNDRTRPLHGSPACTCLFCWGEVMRLRAEVERLQAAGDALAKRTLRAVGNIAAIAAWEEARRG